MTKPCGGWYFGMSVLEPPFRARLGVKNMINNLGRNLCCNIHYVDRSHISTHVPETTYNGPGSNQWNQLFINAKVCPDEAIPRHSDNGPFLSQLCFGGRVLSRPHASFACANVFSHAIAFSMVYCGCLNYCGASFTAALRLDDQPNKYGMLHVYTCVGWLPCVVSYHQ